MRHVITWVALVVLCLAAVGCGSSRLAVSPELTQKVGAACGEYEQFKGKYPELRADVIANRDWLEELLPDLWKTLVYVDAHGKELDAVVALLCRVFGGDEEAAVELEATRERLQAEGVDWSELLGHAVKLATLLATRGVI
ncbi:MAG: hypothetical protein WA208_01470 [Thermoanaerobaculia bacterium]